MPHDEQDAQQDAHRWCCCMDGGSWYVPRQSFYFIALYLFTDSVLIAGLLQLSWLLAGAMPWYQLLRSIISMSLHEQRCVCCTYSIRAKGSNIMQCAVTIAGTPVHHLGDGPVRPVGDDAVRGGHSQGRRGCACANANWQRCLLRCSGCTGELRNIRGIWVLWER